jgi:tRNA(fMet)-specific endonuclease VapC
MGVILDSSLLIEAERERFDFEEFVVAEEIEDARIAAITASELLHGVERAHTDSIRASRSGFVESVLTRFPIEPFTLDTARIHARIWAEMTARGRGIGAHDLIIASTAVEHGLEIASLNVRDFRGIPGVKLTPVAPYRSKGRRR